MIQNQRIPIGVMLVSGILFIPAAAVTASKDTVTFDSGAGEVFIKTLEAIDGPTARVANDFAVAYQARCKAPITLGTLKTAINSENGKRASTILSGKCKGDNICPDLTQDERRQYLRIVTSGVPCDA